MTRRAIRRAVADRLGRLAATGWSQSHFHPDNIGKDARSRVHLSYAIAVGETRRHGAAKVDEGAVSSTMVRVRWVHQLRAGGRDGQVEDYDAALEAEEKLIAAALAEELVPELSMWFETAGDPKPIGDGTYVSGEVRFTTGHLLPLS